MTPVKKASAKKAPAKVPAKKATVEPAQVQPVEPIAEPAPPAKKTAAKAALPQQVSVTPAKKVAAKKTAAKKAPAKKLAKPAGEHLELIVAPEEAIPEEAIPEEATPAEASRQQTVPERGTPAPAIAEVVVPAPVVPEPLKGPAPGAGGIDPAYLPEVLAVAAVDRLGDTARRRVAWYAVRYPGVGADAVSRAITREFVRRARRQGFAAGVAGPVGLLIEAAGVNWLQAKLVLHLAAAYGHDPLDRRRAAELLVLQRVHGSIEAAEAAIRAAEQESGAGRAGRGAVLSRLSGPLARAMGGGLLQAAAARFARRLVPGAGAVLGSVAAARSTEMLAARAVRYYRRR